MPEIGINFYPFTDPIILTDDIFTDYGGNSANTAKAQRDAAYWLAERKASDDLSTLLTRTIVTGTYAYSTRIMVEHNYVHRLILTRFIDFKEDVYYTISGTANVYIGVDDSVRGIIDLPAIVRNCACAYPTWHLLSPYHVELIYEAGLPSGTVYRPDVLLGLTTYAQIILNEIVGFGNEAPGDASITEYKNQSYWEKRRALVDTTFGGSPKANFANKLLKGLRRLKYVGI